MKCSVSGERYLPIAVKIENPMSPASNVCIAQAGQNRMSPSRTGASTTASSRCT